MFKTVIVDKQNKTSFHVVNLQFISGQQIVSLKVVVLQSGWRAAVAKLLDGIG